MYCDKYLSFMFKFVYVFANYLMKLTELGEDNTNNLDFKFRLNMDENCRLHILESEKLTVILKQYEKYTIKNHELVIKKNIDGENIEGSYLIKDIDFSRVSENLLNINGDKYYL